ncbi:bifunctional lysine-specific demethylase and histidyl-hydroxylase no66 [Plasmopara halstedii]|uniref:Bifunctional lysine-specific demethylase and histidyl-hydroxylase n=1 Tax=Plasmopara halstedii TaxID=4781 RepID=A0A0P1A7X7_PLAHL|nr:bifunctional lysine-specific demethylase and histidyl-hydroxylase no66 [Plasmopara halstedii]CEG36622.1 bifunctional lysine-specific demethylase and histidyl-hydroxylase no66 [Plasmopara halstedii]|eukprot:XP_024572991.1 bifunctional lysine-specific demethylase and histidyl-hydroxylase no66 [Plasmopara halstedii]
MVGKNVAKSLSSAPSTKKRKVSPCSSLPLIIEQKIDANDVVDAHDLVSRIDIHSATKARMLLTWLLYPVTPEEFYENYWEQRPLAIKRNYSSYYDGWFSKHDIDRILKTHTLEYVADLDLTKYLDDTRHTLNPSGTATANQVWQHFDEGCSVRLLCPQKYSDNVWKLLATLEDEWGCMAGANTYLTPKNTQGFAPHFDDIEAFLLQMEGSKHWKVYQPMNKSDMLARYPSGNFKSEELGKPTLEIDLDPGDLLYFPRGFVHQARAFEEKHSLHLTVSTGQQNSMGNFLEVLLPQAIASAIDNNVDLRRSLPRDYLEYMGVMHSDRQNDPKRQAFAEKLKNALKTVLGEAMDMLDAASDQMAKNFLVDRLPPVLEDVEENCTSDNSPLQKIMVNTQLKLIRHGVARLVIEEGKAVLYHCRENSRMHHEVPISPLEFELDDAESLEFILRSYPNYFRVGDMPHEDPQDQMALAKALYKEGILMFQKS